MRECLYEESCIPINSSREEVIYKILKIVGIIFLVIAVIVLLPGLLTLFNYFFSEGANTQEKLFSFISALIFFVLLSIVGGILLFVKNKFNVVYDYAFVSGELRVTRIIGNTRKEFLRISADEMRKIGKVQSNGYMGIKRNSQVKEIKFSSNKTPNNGKEFYYIFFTDNMGKKIIILECRKEMISLLATYVSRDTMEQ